jgi:hypothetical protein
MLPGVHAGAGVRPSAVMGSCHSARQRRRTSSWSTDSRYVSSMYLYSSSSATVCASMSLHPVVPSGPDARACSAHAGGTLGVREVAGAQVVTKGGVAQQHLGR